MERHQYDPNRRRIVRRAGGSPLLIPTVHLTHHHRRPNTDLNYQAATQDEGPAMARGFVAFELQKEKETMKHQTPFEYAQAAVLWDDRRNEITPVLIERFGLTEAQADEVVTAAQQGYLAELERLNPEAWKKLGLKPSPDARRAPHTAPVASGTLSTPETPDTFPSLSAGCQRVRSLWRNT